MLRILHIRIHMACSSPPINVLPFPYCSYVVVVFACQVHTHIIYYIYIVGVVFCVLFFFYLGEFVLLQTFTLPKHNICMKDQEC